MSDYSQNSIRLILFFPLLIYEILAYTISFFIPVEKRDLISSFIAGILFSIGLSSMLPRAQRFTSSDYPYAGLISLSIFMILTLFRFITDGLNALNDNLISSFEVINQYTVSNQHYQPTITDSRGFCEKSLHFLKNHMVIILLYIIMMLDSVSNGIFYNCTTIDHSLNTFFITHIFLKFLEQIVIGLCIRETNVSKLYYWVMVLFLGLIEPLLLVLPYKVSDHTAYKLSGYSLSILLGLYFYIGSRAINSAVTTPHTTHIAWSILCFVLSFAVPLSMLFALAEILMKYNKSS